MFFQDEQEVQDPFVEISEMRSGDTIYECLNDINYEYKVVVDAYCGIDGWEAVLEDSDGLRTFIFASHECDPIHLPKFYAIPQILDQDNKGYFHPII
jgi:hypothetical protein